MSILHLAWLIPLFPFLSFVAILLFTYRDQRLSHQLGIGGVAISFLLSQAVFWTMVSLPTDGGKYAFESMASHWLYVGQEHFAPGIYIDPTTAVMLFTVPLIGLLIVIYSVGYMDFSSSEVDPHYSHFFAYSSLLTATMMGMVLSNNLLTLFVFWGLMDLCSYLLIQLRYENLSPTQKGNEAAPSNAKGSEVAPSSVEGSEATPSSAQAGLKTALTGQTGNLFLLLGLVLLYTSVHSLAYRDIFSPETLEQLAHTPFVDLPSLAGSQWSMATIIALLLLAATLSKSAQFPLYTWLPEVIECPIPASALLHTTATVSAGAFLLIRTYPLLTAGTGDTSMAVVATLGAFSAIFSSIVAIAQDDIRRALAFSTVSQLGYVIAALGIGAYVAGLFHLVTHAFSKTLLLLGTGCVVKRVSRSASLYSGRGRSASSLNTGTARAPKASNPNLVTHMGGLAKRMPRTFWTFTIGSLGLSGFPLITAGFWSGNEILTQAYERSPVIFWTLAVAGSATAFYAMRQICVIFLGQPRTQAAELTSESTSLMTTPLLILAVFAVGLGWVAIPEHLPIIGGVTPDWLHHFVRSTTEAAHAVAPGLAWQPQVLSLTFGLGGLLLGWLIYGWKPMQTSEADQIEAGARKVRLGWLYNAARDGFYLSEVYHVACAQGFVLLANLCNAFDHHVIDNLGEHASRFGQATSQACEWLDDHVVSALTNLTGSVTRQLSEVGDLLDQRVMNRPVDLAGPAVQTASEVSNSIDLKVVDGAVEGVSVIVKAGGLRFHRLQNGRIQHYLLWASVAALALLLAFVFILFLQDYLHQISLIVWILVIILLIISIFRFRKFS
jgi:NADH-quinone oxidoreductase subunit L